MSDVNVITIDPEEFGFKKPQIAKPKLPELEVPPIPAAPKLPRSDVDSLIEDLEPAISATGDVEETQARIRNAFNISDTLLVDPKYSYSKQYEIMEQWTGEKTSAKNFWGYWKDMAKYHRVRTEQSKIAGKMMWEPDPEKRDAYWMQIEELDSQLPPPDTVKRFFPLLIDPHPLW